MKKQTLVVILLRLSISSVFFYASVAATIQPYNWIGYIPQFFDMFAPVGTLLIGFSIFQFLLAVWILSGIKPLFSSALASLTLLAIIGANWGDLNILFRDFAIFFASLALGIYSLNNK
ncbi:MAG TPA: hypothetical protein VF189_06370 [Patescibacteria group bacterium]